MRIRLLGTGTRIPSLERMCSGSIVFGEDLMEVPVKGPHAGRLM